MTDSYNNNNRNEDNVENNNNLMSLRAISSSLAANRHSETVIGGSTQKITSFKKVHQ